MLPGSHMSILASLLESKRKDCRMKKLFIALCVILLVTSGAVFAANEGFKIQYDGKTVDYTAEPMTVTVNDKGIEMPLAPILFNDRALVPVREVFEAMGAEVSYKDNGKTKKVTVENDDVEIVITINSSTAYVNDAKKTIPDKLTPKLINKVDEDAKTMVPIRFLSENLGMKVLYDNDTRNIAIYTPDYKVSTLVVLDAGHGGADSGAVGKLNKDTEDEKTVLEKNLTISVTKKVYKILKDNGIDVILTRDKDVKPELSERADFANKSGAGIFVSIHINSVDKPEPYGIETYYCTTNNSQYSGISSKDLAKDIQKNLIDDLDGKNRGVKTANFYVIRETEMPAVLIELGFISNEEELKKMCDEEYQDKAAQAIADGIIKNVGEIKSNAKENGISIKPVSDKVLNSSGTAAQTKTEQTSSEKTEKEDKTENKDTGYPIKKDDN